jgi:hypothetical protein
VAKLGNASNLPGRAREQPAVSGFCHRLLSDFPKRWPQRFPLLLQVRHLKYVARFGVIEARQFPADNWREILIQRVKGIGLQFPEGAAQLVHDPVNRVEKETFFHFQLAAAQFPIGAEKKVKSKYFVLEFVQYSLADEAKISDVFFILASPNLAPVAAANDLETRLAHVFLLPRAISES